jgi:autocrine motility factor receptor
MQPQQQTSQLRNMARGIQEMFPRYPLNALIADLQITHSSEHTIDNILEGRLPVPRNVSDDESPSTSSSQPYPTASDYYIAADEITASSSSSSSSASSTDQYEIEQHGSAVFGNRAELLRDDSPESQGEAWGGQGTAASFESPEEQFAKSSQEREKLLQRRKEQMLITARKR